MWDTKCFTIEYANRATDTKWRNKCCLKTSK